jgi:hypothetical protein
LLRVLLRFVAEGYDGFIKYLQGVLLWPVTDTMYSRQSAAAAAAVTVTVTSGPRCSAHDERAAVGATATSHRHATANAAAPAAAVADPSSSAAADAAAGSSASARLAGTTAATSSHRNDDHSGCYGTSSLEDLQTALCRIEEKEHVSKLFYYANIDKPFPSELEARVRNAQVIVSSLCSMDKNT